MDNEHASQFEFRPSGASFVCMYDLKLPGDKPVWTGHYARQGRQMLDGRPNPDPLAPDPHMQIIADKLNEAAKSLNEALRRV